METDPLAPGVIAAVDWETYYHEKAYSVGNKGTYGYFEDERFDAYLVSVVLYDHTLGPIEDNLDAVEEFCGPHEDFDWDCICDPSITWVSHNRSFDYSLHQWLVQQGLMQPHDFPVDRWHCTADMVSYFGLPRALKNVIKFCFGHEMDKSIRDEMSGVDFHELDEEKQGQVIEYALEDSRWLHRLIAKFYHQWPEHERQISVLTTDMTNRGVPINIEQLGASIQKVKNAQFESEKAIPWEWGPESRYRSKTPLSQKLMAQECRKLGIPVPKSRAKTEPSYHRWAKQYGKKAPFVEAMGEWNAANTLLKKLEVMEQRTREIDGWGWLYYNFKYCGAHTGRDAGGGGLNMLNLNRTEVAGVNLRGLIQPPPGHLFLSADYSQIEPRVLAWMCEDWKFLDALRGEDHPDVYVKFGQEVLGHKGEWTSSDRQAWKAMVLGLGYGCGASNFVNVAKTLAGLEISKEESEDLVDLYRKKNWRVRKYWKHLETMLRDSAAKDGWLVFQLPSGRPQIYRSVSRLRGLSAIIADESTFQQRKFWGGKLCENVVQAVARDFFFDGYLNLEANGITSVLRIYDEFLALVREDEAEEKAKLMQQIMETPPDWGKDVPLSAEVEILTEYKK